MPLEKSFSILFPGLEEKSFFQYFLYLLRVCNHVLEIDATVNGAVKLENHLIHSDEWCAFSKHRKNNYKPALTLRQKANALKMFAQFHPDG